MKNAVVTVLKTGGDIYNEQYVKTFFAVLNRYNCTRNYDLICLTDSTKINSNIQTMPLTKNLASWWSKLEMFTSPQLKQYNRIVYFDLDTLIVGDIAFLFDYVGLFAGLGDFYRPTRFASGILLFDPNSRATNNIAYDMEHNPGQLSDRTFQRGDQQYLETTLVRKCHIKYDTIQQLFPDKVASYKVHYMVKGPALLNQISVLCYHGQPKPHNVDDPILFKIWNEN